MGLGTRGSSPGFRSQAVVDDALTMITRARPPAGLDPTRPPQGGEKSHLWDVHLDLSTVSGLW